MRDVHQLVHSRTRVRSRYALMPLEGFPTSRLPSWPTAQARVLASPALGARFVQMLIDLPARERGRFPAEADVETFYFCLDGNGIVQGEGRSGRVEISPGCFGLAPAGSEPEFVSTNALRLLFLRKRCERADGIEPHGPLHGQESRVKKDVWADNPHSLLQTLIPDDLQYDLAMNIFTFDPGHGLPIVETHVMEHGLFFLQGKGLYFLDDQWMEVEKDDFVWMGPYCPQSFYATGSGPARYIYYKNVNREISINPQG